MIHPSYFELMELVNKDVKEGEEPIVSSRYSIVLGTAKRARQIIEANHVREDMEEGLDNVNREKKPLSVAVEELNAGDIHIVRGEDEV